MKAIISVSMLIILNVSLFSQWQLTAGTGTAYGNTLYCVGDTLYAGTDFGAYKTTNNGNTWITINNGFNTYRKIYDFTYSEGKLWSGNDGSGLYFSLNYGENWIREYSASFTRVYSVAAANQYVLASNGTYVYYTTNLGTNWIIMDGGTEPWGEGGIVIDNSFVYSADFEGVYVSFLGGTSWTRINGNLAGNSKDVDEIRFANNKLYIATKGGVWSSSNNGTTWENLNPSWTNTSLWALSVTNSNIFVATNNSKIYLSTNNGTNWSDISAGLPANIGIDEITCNSTHAFAMVYQTGAVYRRPLSELIGIQPISSEVPKQFSLSQNYPNPFNPVTNINFNVKKRGLVKLAVFNSIGQEIETLINQQLSPGSFKVDWNAASHPSGVYYYKIAAGEYTETRKMILIK